MGGSEGPGQYAGGLRAPPKPPSRSATPGETRGAPRFPRRRAYATGPAVISHRAPEGVSQDLRWSLPARPGIPHASGHAEGVEAGDVAADDEGVDVVRALVGVDGLEVEEVADDG